MQHQDGHSHVLASTVPNLKSYDPAFAFEIAVIVRDGIRRMYGEFEDIFYYITVTNQNYRMPPKPERRRRRYRQGHVLFPAHRERGEPAQVNLLGSGAIMLEVMAAAETLEGLGIRDQHLERYELQRTRAPGRACAERAQIAERRRLRKSVPMSRNCSPRRPACSLPPPTT